MMEIEVIFESNDMIEIEITQKMLFRQTKRKAAAEKFGLIDQIGPLFWVQGGMAVGNSIQHAFKKLIARRDGTVINLEEDINGR